MSEINKKTKIEELAIIVCDALLKKDINTVLTGGAVVSIYSNNEYVSSDLDFISYGDDKKIKEVMEELGFTIKEGRYYTHKNTNLFVEFPPPPLAIGNTPIKKVAEIKKDGKVLRLLTPTQCVMDRLAAYFYWNDLQCLEQAVQVAQKHPIDLNEIRKWAKEDDVLDKFNIFRKRI